MRPYRIGCKVKVYTNELEYIKFKKINVYEVVVRLTPQNLRSLYVIIRLRNQTQLTQASKNEYELGSGFMQNP